MALLVGTALILLAAINAVEITAAYRSTPAPVPTRAPAPSTAGARAQAVRPSQPSAQFVDTILARPLFEPTRRPIGGPAATAQGAPGLPRIAGIVVGPSDRLVIFAAENGGKPITVAQGSKLNGFLIQSIQANAVTIVGPGGERTLHPSFDPTVRRTQPQAHPPTQGGFPRPGIPLNFDNTRPHPPGFVPPSQNPSPDNNDD